MNKLFKKILTITLVFTMLFSTTTVIYAAPIESNDSINTVEGMDRFLQKTSNGTVVLDLEGARTAGYTETAISVVQDQIDFMNNLVVNNGAYIDDNFNAIIYVPSTRARGETKVVTTWYGLTQIYMNSDDTQSFIKGLQAAGGASTIAGIVGFIPGSIATLLGKANWIFGVGVLMYTWQAEQAAASGRGIIMNVYRDPSDIESIWFESQ